MPRSQFDPERYDPPLFVNRDEQLRFVAGHLDLLGTDPGHFAVLEVVGLGGAGKTQLLNEIRRRAGGDRAQRVMSITLATEASETEIAPLRQVRRQVNFDCHLFDSALITLLGTTGQPFPPDLPNLTKSLAYSTLDIARAAAHLPVPVTFAVSVFSALKRKVTKTWHYEEREFAQIDALREDVDALRARLPHWLGIDILRRINSTSETLAMFYDGYEKQSAATREDSSPWLRELIGTLGRGVHVITTRDSIAWDERDWGDVTSQIHVESLPARDARELVRTRLRHVPIETEDWMLQVSGRLPFYLEAAITAYRRSAERGEAFDHAPSTPSDLLARLLNHLEHRERALAIALATVQVFDRQMFDGLIRRLHMAIDGPDFSHYVRHWFSIEPLNTTLYKTHDLLSDFVRRADEQADRRTEALVAATDELCARCLAGGLSSSILSMFGGVVAGWRSVQDVPTRTLEALVDIGYHLYDAGYWHELSAMATESAPGRRHPTRAVTDLLLAITSRRTHGVDHAIEKIAEVEPHAATLGRHARSIEIEAAYLSELSGNYGVAREQFRLLDKQAVPFDGTNRTHVRARLYRADMMINDGTFHEASRLLLDAMSAVDPTAAMTEVELGRHRAHAFRFSFMLVDAARQYRELLMLANGAPGLLGKLHTNLAETACWHEPEAALKAAAESTARNDSLGNRIELAKCDAARGIALGRLGEFRAARDALARSKAVADRVGYPAGAAFAMQAEVIVEHLAGNPKGLEAARRTLAQAVATLGTYGHLQLIPAFLAGDAKAVADMSESYDWIAPETLIDRLRDVFGATSFA
ncbi:MAG: hypothetical protein ITG02_04250 [Patulibacter sp.]|nr:hypothetical protein [Patulibacter sp.]